MGRRPSESTIRVVYIVSLYSILCACVNIRSFLRAAASYRALDIVLVGNARAARNQVYARHGRREDAICCCCCCCWHHLRQSARAQIHLIWGPELLKSIIRLELCAQLCVYFRRQRARLPKGFCTACLGIYREIVIVCAATHFKLRRGGCVVKGVLGWRSASGLTNIIQYYTRGRRRL